MGLGISCVAMVLAEVRILFYGIRLPLDQGDEERVSNSIGEVLPARRSGGASDPADVP